MAQIIVELPDHLAKDFLGWMSNQGEQDYMEAYHDFDDALDGVCFDYPGWKDKILITEYKN